jgi:hypothetical protein
MAEWCAVRTEGHESRLPGGVSLADSADLVFWAHIAPREQTYERSMKMLLVSV